MKSIADIDFSSLEEYKESATVQLDKDTVVELPLLTLRDVPQAILLLRQFSNIQNQWNLTVARMENRKAQCEQLADGYLENENVTPKDEDYQALSDTADFIMKLQGEVGKLIEKTHEITDLAHKFMSNYPNMDRIVSILKTKQDAVTFKLLEGMIYGKDAFKEPEDAPEKPEGEKKISD
jgi:hypothetical protein